MVGRTKKTGWVELLRAAQKTPLRGGGGVLGRDPNEARPVTQAREEDAIGEGAAGAPGRGRRVLGVSHPRGTEAGRSGTGINYVHVVAGSQLMGGLAGPGGDPDRACSDSDDKP